jgi:hypothetical protein
MFGWIVTDFLDSLTILVSTVKQQEKLSVGTVRTKLRRVE